MTASQANSFLAEIQVFNTDIIQLIEINGLTPNCLEKIRIYRLITHFHNNREFQP